MYNCPDGSKRCCKDFEAMVMLCSFQSLAVRGQTIRKRQENACSPTFAAAFVTVASPNVFSCLSSSKLDIRSRINLLRAFLCLIGGTKQRNIVSVASISVAQSTTNVSRLLPTILRSEAILGYSSAFADFTTGLRHSTQVRIATFWKLRFL
jgi:hypothetical protein